MKITFLIGHMVKERDLILYELAEDLGKHGGDVTIISGYPSRRISDEIRNKYLAHSVEKISENVTSIRVGTKKGEGKGLLERMLKYLLLSKAIVDKAITVDTDVIYIYSTPPFLAYYAKKLKRIAPVVYNAQDLFPDSLKNAKKFGERNILIQIFRLLEKFVYNNCDKIITISEDMKEHIIANGANRDKTIVINNWADTTAITPINRGDNSLFEEYGIEPQKLTILYAGDIGIHQRLDLFIDIADMLKQNKNIQFIFFGNGAYEQELKSQILGRKITNFYVFPLQPVERIAEVYSLGDIDIVSLEKGMTKLALPSKLWSVMSAGRPILALLDKESEVAEMIDGKIGYVIDGKTKEEIVELIEKMITQRDNLETMGQLARECVTVNNNRNQQTLKYYDVLEELVKP